MIPCPDIPGTGVAKPPMRITLVEPDEAVREALKTLLEGRGWNVNALACGADLDHAFGDDSVCAVVCEAALPDREAEDVLKDCRRKRVPVIFLGHDQDVQGAVDLVRQGATDFLEKPFRQGRLLALLDSLADSNTP